MAQVYSALLLSGSTNGKPIAIAATSSPGTLLHTAVSGTTAMDEVYCYFANNSDDIVTLTVQWGSTTAVTGSIFEQYAIPPRSLPLPLVCGQRLQNGGEVRAYASAANVITCTGGVNRIT